MKPFSKMEALQGKPVVTENGKKVTIIGEVPADVEYPVVGFIEGGTEVDTWTSDGQYYNTETGPVMGPLNLQMAPEKHEGYIAFGLNYDPEELGLAGFATHVWPTEEGAKKAFKRGTSLEASGTTKVSWGA